MQSNYDHLWTGNNQSLPAPLVGYWLEKSGLQFVKMKTGVEFGIAMIFFGGVG